MVFIRPTILRTPEDAAALAARRYATIREQQLAQKPEEEPSIDELLRDYMGIEPPIPLPPIDTSGAAAPTTSTVTPSTSTRVIRPVDLPPSLVKP